MAYYDKLLNLCGYEPEEMEKEKSRVGRAFEIAGIDAGDCRLAEERLNKYFDLELMGVRKFLGIWLKEFTDMVLARPEGKKIVYTSYPSYPQIASTIVASSEDIYCASPEVVIDHVLGQIFDKLTPVLEEAEQKCHLPPGLANCSFVQARVGTVEKGIISKPDVVVSSSFFCDQVANSDELYFGLKHGIPVEYVDGMIDQDGGKWPENHPQLVKYGAQELREAFKLVENITGVKVNDQVIKDGGMKAARCAMAYMSIFDLLQVDPIPLSHKDFGLITWCLRTGIRRGMDEGPKAANILVKELKKRIDAGIGVLPKGSPRVYMTLPPLNDPSIVGMVEDVGLAIPATLHSIIISPSVQSPSIYTDNYERIADMNMRSPHYHSNLGYSRAIIQLIRKMNLDGALNAVLFSCRPIAPLGVTFTNMCKKEGIPVLTIEFDLYDSRDYSAQQLRTRVETFAEMLKAEKMAKAS